MRWRRWHQDEDGLAPVLVGAGVVGGLLGASWLGADWASSLLRRAGGELTAWVLSGAFWVIDLVAAQAAAAPAELDVFTPVLEGPALPIWALAALVCVAALLAEVIGGVVTGNVPRMVTAVFRAIIAGLLATAGGSLLLMVGGALSDLGRIALQASGTTVDAPLLPLQEVLMETARAQTGAPELFVAFLAALVIVFSGLAIYFLLAMRPVLLAILIVFLPVAHALSVWEPLRRVQLRAWALAFAVLLSDAAVLTMFAVANTAAAQVAGVDRLIFGTFGMLLAALAPAALARVVGAPELQTAVTSMSSGSRRMVGTGAVAAKGALFAAAYSARRHHTATGGTGAVPETVAAPTGGWSDALDAPLSTGRESDG